MKNIIQLENEFGFTQIENFGAYIVMAKYISNIEKEKSVHREVGFTVIEKDNLSDLIKTLQSIQKSSEKQVKNGLKKAAKKAIKKAI